MGRLIAVLLPFLLWSSAPVLAPAQSAEVTLTVGWSTFTNNTIAEEPRLGAAPDPATLDNGVRIGARLSINRWTFLGHELSYAWQRSSFKIADQEFGGMSIQHFYYNFVVHATPSGTVVRPFVTAGGGFSSFFPPGVSSFSGGGDTEFGFNVGAGLKFKLADNYGIRIDLRDHVTGKPFDRFFRTTSGRLHNVEYSGGFSLLF